MQKYFDRGKERQRDRVRDRETERGMGLEDRMRAITRASMLVRGVLLISKEAFHN